MNDNKKGIDYNTIHTEEMVATIMADIRQQMSMVGPSRSDLELASREGGLPIIEAWVRWSIEQGKILPPYDIVAAIAVVQSRVMRSLAVMINSPEITANTLFDMTKAASGVDSSSADSAKKQTEEKSDG